MHADERSIRELISSWQERTRRGDVEGVLQLMTEDVVFSVVGREPFGKAEFAAATRQLEGTKLDIEQEVLEVTLRGDTAWARSRLAVSMTDPQGKQRRHEGHTLSIFVKGGDAAWRLARDANLLGPGQ
jgi:uncharacterized protein (TIGR02246 family)